MNRNEVATALRSTRDVLLAKLHEAMEERPKRQKFIKAAFGGDQEPEWAAHEREVMHTAVTRERSKRSKAPLSITEIATIEQLCVGHSDYDTKFALRCAELVFQEELTPAPAPSV